MTTGSEMELSPKESLSGFPPEIVSVSTDLRIRFAAVIEALCGGRPRAQDVTDQFGVHRKLGWQIWNVAYADDPLAAIRFMPNPRGVEVWREAAENRGVHTELLNRLTDACERFDALVTTHAGDRQTLEMMVEGRDPGADESTESRWRKQAFTGNSYIWGVRAKRLLATVLLHPSKSAGFFDMVRVHGMIGLIRTRSTVRWPFAQSVVQTDDGAERAPLREPLMPSSAVDRVGVPLMEAFCSNPLPPVQRRLNEESGMVEDELLPGPVGQTAASTVMTGEILRAVAPVNPTREGEVALFGTGVRTPTELLISDHFVHKDLWPGVPRELRVFGEMISATTVP